MIPQGWEALRRIVAFLGTGLEIRTTQQEPSWPFHDHEEWYLHEPLLDEIDLPVYDPVMHGRQVNPWWNRIPSGIGFAVIAALMAVVALAVCLL